MKLLPLLLVATPLCLLAQSPTPADALRERAQKFYAALVAQKPRLSNEFVCEAGKDIYYQSQKPFLSTAEVDAVTLSADQTSAVVKTLIRPNIPIQLDKPMTPIPVESNWKLESDQWCYVVPTAAPVVMTPFGPMDFSKGSVSMNPARVAEVTKSMAEKVRFSKAAFALPLKKSGHDELEITNDLNGEVQLNIFCPAVRGLTCRLDKTTLHGSETAKLRVDFRYAKVPLAASQTVTVRVQPFGRLVRLAIVAPQN